MSEDIRQYIIKKLSKEKSITEILEKVNRELDMMEVTDGLDGRSNLENFYDIVKKRYGQTADENKINSWTAWALNLTNKKPTGEFLQERRAFARAGLPDIDSDFEYFRRNEVYDYIIKKYGRENVSKIGTYMGLKLRSCLIRVIKSLDIAKSWHKGKQEFKTDNMVVVEEILGQLPKSIGGKMKAKDQEGKDVVLKKIGDAYKYCDDFKFYMDKYPEIMKHSSNIEGLLSSFSVHPAGIVVSKEPISGISPIRKARGEGEYATQYVYEELESIGLVKFDILAIAALTVIDRTVKMVKENYGIDIDIENLKYDDKKTFDLYKSGKLDGVFQCESGGMQNTLKDICPDNLNDICAAIALFRPGPMINIPEYCARKRGDAPISYFHPSIEPHVKKYLYDTYGLAVYQEQIMQICNSLAGFSIADGYVVIKGIGKKKENIINKYKKKFIEGCIKNGVPKDVASEYWEKFITPFASYGFNRSHSLAYAATSYCMAYLKANYTAEFLVCSLNVTNEQKKHDRLAKMEKDLRKFDMELGPKNINNCYVNYTIVKKKDVESGVDKTIISPTIMVKGVGYNAAEEIDKKKPYKDLKDMAIKTNSKLVDKETIASLYDAGFFSGYVKDYYRKTKQRLTKELLLDKFVGIRQDIEKAAKKGVQLVDMFE